MNVVRSIQRSKMGRPRPRSDFSKVTSQGLEALHATFAANRTTSSGIAQSNSVRVAVNRDTTGEIVTARGNS